MFCRELLAQFERASDSFKAAGVRVVAVTMGDPRAAESFCGRRAPSVTCVSDPTKAAYAAYGLRRGSVTEVAGPAVWAAGLRAAARGHVNGTPVGDTMMMPGTFAIDAGGIIRAVHYARHSGDQPALGRMLATLGASRQAHDPRGSSEGG